MRKVIQELLDSSISTSAISQGAGVPWSTISDLRKGKTSMDKMALLTAEKLYEFATSKKTVTWHCFLLVLEPIHIGIDFLYIFVVFKDSVEFFKACKVIT